LGKGIAAASLGAILESRGIKVTHLKLDPYITYDPGTMSRVVQHGAVFVTEDGAETDLASRPLRARYTSARVDRASQQLHDRPDLRVVIKKTSARRVSG